MTDCIDCPYCQRPAKLVSGLITYPHRNDLKDKLFWHCAQCNAFVGCHPGTERPLGELANAELRRLRMYCHAGFDVLWKKGDMKRTQAYAWLAGELKIKQDDCHIGSFNEDQCLLVLRILDQRRKGMSHAG